MMRILSRENEISFWGVLLENAYSVVFLLGGGWYGPIFARRGGGFED